MKTKEMSKQQRPDKRLVTIFSSLGKRRAMVFTVAALICCATVVLAVRGYSIKAPAPVKSSSSARIPVAAVPSVATTQGGSQSKSRLHSSLGLQPEADKMRRRLGRRFLRAGQEIGDITGTLTTGNVRQGIRITRTQNDDGEAVSISLNGQSGAWTASEGATLNGRTAVGEQRTLIERLVLDSPDHFILAQTRGAAYYTIARAVAPKEASDDDSYEGPIWDLIRITEPQSATVNKPEVEWRIFYINNATGMIDKILYQEEGETTTVELAGWANRNGEVTPTTIRWTREGRVLMELSLENISYVSK
jgi:hypothetical protein